MQPILLGIITIGFAVAIVLVSAMRPHRSTVSNYELRRRADNGDSRATNDERRNKAFHYIRSLQQILLGLLGVLFVSSIVAWLGTGLGVLFALALYCLLQLFTRIPLCKKTAQKFYNNYEAPLVNFVLSHKKLLWWVSSSSNHHEEHRITSRWELEHLVDTSDAILSEEEKTRIKAGLQFTTKRVHDSMTPIADVKTIKRTEILGPLVLDDLHKSGHSKFPVVDENANIVGILTVRDVLTIDTTRKHTSMVETAMSKKLFYVHKDQPLSAALGAFMNTHSHMLIVIDTNEEVVGILSLHDTLEVLIGKSLHDSFNDYDDKRAVASRSN
ncbi:MAG TPA: CBS domain-containing protein [Candidatus Saccharibacteria bacterium]|nr:CBS domain-containing protein [Candidatus Saccharibacteria bacterium]